MICKSSSAYTHLNRVQRLFNVQTDKLYCFCKSLILKLMPTRHFTIEWQQKTGPPSVHLFLFLSVFLSYLPFTCFLSLSPSPAVFLLTLTMCAVNNWWSSLTQRVTGPRENVSPISLFIYNISLSPVSLRNHHKRLFKCRDWWACSSLTVPVMQFVAAAAPETMSGLMLPVWLTAGQREEREA